MEEEAPSLQNRVEALTHQYTQLYQVYVDKSVPYTLYRWCGFGAVLLVFLLRILLKQGYYIGKRAAIFRLMGHSLLHPSNLPPLPVPRLHLTQV